MANEHICPCTNSCPLQRTMSAIGGRWKMAILCSLSHDGTTRYNDLKRKITGISNTMLAKSLKELEDDRLVKRTVYSEVPIRVEYEVTDAVRSLMPILTELAVWGNNSISPNRQYSAAESDS